MGINPRTIGIRPPTVGFWRSIFNGGIGFFGGLYYNYWYMNEEGQRMSRFRDKSALFGRDLGPDDPPSWGWQGPYQGRQHRFKFEYAEEKAD